MSVRANEGGTCVAISLPEEVCVLIAGNMLGVFEKWRFREGAFSHFWHILKKGQMRQ